MLAEMFFKSQIFVQKPKRLFFFTVVQKKKKKNTRRLQFKSSSKLAVKNKQKKKKCGSFLCEGYTGARFTSRGKAVV